MTDAPPYFEDVRATAARRWVQLEQDPVLAGPWHQLFKQVQSPRHVVSELLQNADDAGATMASADIQDGEFIFIHNGEDFTEEHFISLCRFGYSNKRSLHTIGFRGIGFKSTFSLGDEVRLRTPSLSVAFRRSRFTEPLWMARNGVPARHTEVRVTIQDPHRQRELKKNLDDWTKSPASLLFFRSIRCLTISGREIRWESQAAGPVPGSSWFSLAGTPDRRVLLIQSDPEPFPAEALDEIRQERMVAVDEETALPPCTVDLVLGMEGRLFVILPTGVLTKLPFACNAPFIQDPARVKIKDPETSPTNRWLLDRVGRLAAETLLHWVGNVAVGIEKRCDAYALLPDLDRDDHSLEGDCGRIAEEACESAMAGKPFLVLEDGSLAKEKGCVAVPRALLDVWPNDLVSRLFTDSARPILSHHISAENRKKLINWNSIDQISKEDVLTTLKSKHLPKPDSWAQLLLLWAYVAEDVVGYHYNRNHKDVRILPVHGKDVLYAANEIVRLGEKKLLQSQEDWEFLAAHLLVLNQNWPRFLAEQRRRAEQDKDDDLGRQVESAYKVFDAVNLGQASDVSQVIQQAAEKFFGEQECDMEDCIRLAQLAATLGASVSESFQFVTRDGYRRPVNERIVYDANNDLDAFVPDQWYQSHVLHEDYRVLLSCTEEDWQQWVTSGRSGLVTFVPLVPMQNQIWGREKLEKLLQERDYNNNPYYPYVTHEFIIDDWDFDNTHWAHWKLRQKEDGEYWGRLFRRVLDQAKDYWANAISAKVSQIATTGTKRTITYESVLPSWIVKFGLAVPTGHNGGLPTARRASLPTPAPTFAGRRAIRRAEIDSETNRQLLVMLGVRDTPTGPRRLLDRLRALATVENPPVYEVEKWCRRLDQLLTKCSTPEFNEIKSAFVDEKLILTAESEWVTAAEAFLSADEEDAPGAAVVHPAIHDLSMWRRLGVADRPTGDLAMRWLADMDSGKKLSKDELRRVRALLPRHPERIWRECGHWLNLEGEWVPVEQLSYKLTMQTLIPWANLFRPIKQKTADFQKLTVEMCGQHPFAALPTLADCIEDRFDERIDDSAEELQKVWLTALGDGLARIQLDAPEETARMRELGCRLARTQFRFVTALEATPYIDGVPSGTPRHVDVLWKADALYVESKSVAKMAKAIALELGRHFGRPDIADAIKLCFEREREFINEYLEENFNLLPPSSGTATPEFRSKTEPFDQPSPTGLEDAAQITKPPTGESGAVQIDGPTPDAPEGEAAGEPTQPDLDEDDNRNVAPAPRRHPQQPTKPKLIERFAVANGYVRDNSEGRFYREDGGWIERASGASFPWERYSPAGELLQCYWVKDHCIEREPLQIEAEVWELCANHPEKYSLLLVDADDNPLVITGRRLREMCDGGELTLYPAKYRLVYEHDRAKEKSDE
jgi:hypothetical protein